MDKVASKWAQGKWLRNAGVLLLGLASLFQLIQVSRLELFPFVRSMAQRPGANAIERSALFFSGKEFSEFILFLNENVPPEAVILIPRFEQNELFGHEGIMEFYLFPRKVENCSPNVLVEDCILNRRGQDNYILAIEGFPPRSAAEQVKKWMPFKGERGVYIPIP